MLRIRLLIPFLIAFFTTKAQDPGSNFFRDDVKNERFDAGSPFISGMIIPSFSPEMEFNISGALLLSFKTRKNNPYLSYSNLPAVLSITPRGDIFYSAILTSYWFDNRFRFTLLTSYLNRDDNYWGVGMDKGESVPKGDLTTAFHQEHAIIKPVFSLRILNSIYAGLVLNRINTNATELNDLMLEDPDVLASGTSVLSTGAGLSVTLDTRDIPTLPERGILAGIEGIFYHEAILSDTDFKTLEIDYRQYIPAVREGSVIAWQINVRFSDEQIPWTEMPQLGSMNDLRGYYYGQYRDRSAGYMLLEYRHTFFRKSDLQPSRHAFVFWLGGGSAFENISSINKGIFSTGLGYRYQLLPKSNLRLDIGFGTEYAGIYLGFYEAF